jgi:hypothetical protein
MMVVEKAETVHVSKVICSPKPLVKSMWRRDILTAPKASAVNALDAALRKSLVQFYPTLAMVMLVD